MTPIKSARAATVLALALSAALATGGRAGEGSVVPDPMVFVPPSAKLLNPGKVTAVGTEDEVTRNAVSTFEEARILCARVPDPAYQIDCLADQLAQLAENLPQTAEFADVRQVVQDTANRLEQVARRNASTTKRPARLRQDTADEPKRSSRPIVPIATERLEAANALATTILREAETVLLRAGERSERRKVAFTQVALAVGSSSTILLRSR